MPKVKVAPGVALHVDVRGEGDQTLVLLNGMSQSTSNWLSQIRRLAERFKVIAYDARGQGRSDLGAEPLSLALHTADLNAVLDYAQVQRASLVGFSYGARVGLGFAARTPQRVDKLVLTSIGAGDSALRRVTVRAWRKALELGGLEAMAWVSLPSILGDAILARYERGLNAMIEATLRRNSVEGLRALLDSLEAFPPPEDDAPEVSAPTLLISSDRDPLVDVAGVNALAERFADAEHRVFSGCGHTIPIESPEQWREAVVRFLLQ